jgi:hypothetical protein
VNRTPPADVRRVLRQEIGFGCPVPRDGETCGNPYLYYHHFDPPWAERHHHEPSGMITLCGEHHAKADAGTFTRDQLRAFKQARGGSAIRGRFDWMREKLLAVVGGNFYYETPVPLRVGSVSVIAFDRDDQGHFLLNVNMPSTTPEVRVRIEQNDWIETGQPSDLESPPNGRLLRVRYKDGDTLRVEFQEVESEQLLLAQYGESALPRLITTHAGEFEYPLLTVSITMRIGDHLELGERASRIGGMTMTGNVAAYCGIGLQLG